MAAGIPEFVRDPAKIQISHSVAQISGLHRGAKPRLVIHIQDAHANVSAQENLAKIQRLCQNNCRQVAALSAAISRGPTVASAKADDSAKKN